MRSGTNLGAMSKKKTDNISNAIVHILIQSSNYENALVHSLGLSFIENFSEEDIKWVVEKITRPTTLTSRNINERLEERYKLNPQKITRLIKRMKIPGDLITHVKYSKKEYVLMPSITRNLLFGE